jgi:hypothetical protein
MSVAQQIQAKLKEIPAGTPFTHREFIALGRQRNIGKVLERLVHSGKVKRVRRGVYICPKQNPHVGEVPASVYEVVKVITSITGEVIQVQGAEAAKLLGLSTQAPLKETYLTNGRSRKLRIGKQEVQFKHVSPKKLILAGTPAGLAITALWYLGKEEVTVEVIEKIRKRITMEEFEKFLSKKECMPAWMAAVVNNYEQQIKRHQNEQTTEPFRKFS